MKAAKDIDSEKSYLVRLHGKTLQELYFIFRDLKRYHGFESLSYNGLISAILGEYEDIYLFMSFKKYFSRGPHSDKLDYLEDLVKDIEVLAKRESDIRAAAAKRAAAAAAEFDALLSNANKLCPDIDILEEALDKLKPG